MTGENIKMGKKHTNIIYDPRTACQKWAISCWRGLQIRNRGVEGLPRDIHGAVCSLEPNHAITLSFSVGQTP